MTEEQEARTMEDLAREAEEDLGKEVEPDNKLKSFFIEYVGSKYLPEGGEVTVDLCVRALAQDFPEFLSPVCEQNFMLGYLQCEKDIKVLMEQQRESSEEDVSE